MDISGSAALRGRRTRRLGPAISAAAAGRGRSVSSATARRGRRDGAATGVTATCTILRSGAVIVQRLLLWDDCCHAALARNTAHARLRAPRAVASAHSCQRLTAAVSVQARCSADRRAVVTPFRLGTGRQLCIGRHRGWAAAGRALTIARTG
eukprot:162858-Chlamydomonas_euryale.AAC.1